MLTRPAYLRIQIAPTRRTDLFCIVCGRFRTELAIIPVGGDTSRETLDSQAGIHRTCRDGLHQKKKATADHEPTATTPAPTFSSSPRAMLAGDVCDPKDDDAERELRDEQRHEKVH